MDEGFETKSPVQRKFRHISQGKQDCSKPKRLVNALKEHGSTECSVDSPAKEPLRKLPQEHAKVLRIIYPRRLSQDILLVLVRFRNGPAPGLGVWLRSPSSDNLSLSSFEAEIKHGLFFFSPLICICLLIPRG